MKSSILILALAVLSVASLARDNYSREELQSKLDAIHLYTGAKWTIVDFNGGKNPPECIISPDSDLFVWFKITEALGEIEENDRMFCGLAADLSISRKVHFRREFKKNESIVVTLENNPFSDPFEVIEIASPSPFTSYMLSSDVRKAWPVYLVCDDDSLNTADQEVQWDSAILELDQLASRNALEYANADRASKAQILLSSAKGFIDAVRTKLLIGSTAESEKVLAFKSAQRALDLVKSEQGEASDEGARLLEQLDSLVKANH